MCVPASGCSNTSTIAVVRLSQVGHALSSTNTAMSPVANEYRGRARLETLVSSGSVAEIAARHRFVPYESMASAKASGWLTVTATITLRDGTRLRLNEQMSSEYLTKDNSEVFKHYLARAGR